MQRTFHISLSSGGLVVKPSLHNKKNTRKLQRLATKLNDKSEANHLSDFVKYFVEKNALTHGIYN